MINLREQIELDLAESIEGEWKMPVELTSPDGVQQILNKNDPTELLGGQVLYFTSRENPVTGETMIVNNPVITLRISSLDRVPQPGEKWYIKIPISPVSGAPKVRFLFSADRTTESGTDIGFIRIYPQKIEAEDEPTS